MEFVFGEYSWVIECGFEYEWEVGKVVVLVDVIFEIRVEFVWIINFREFGWYSGDLYLYCLCGEVE